MNPNDYAKLKLDDQFIEDIMQEHEAKWLLRKTIMGESILDLGYGSGIICRALGEAGRFVTVVDGAKEFTEAAVKIDNVCAVHSLFEEFDLDKNPFHKYHCVIASFILEHVQDPIRLLKRCHQWSKKLIVVVGNANSIHRQVAVKMKLQNDIYCLSDRDYAVGHYMVYDLPLLKNHLDAAGWEISETEGFFVKPLNNGRMTQWEPELIHALNRVKIPPEISANIGVVCHPKHTVS